MLTPPKSKHRFFPSDAILNLAKRRTCLIVLAGDFLPFSFSRIILSLAHRTRYILFQTLHSAAGDNHLVGRGEKSRRGNSHTTDMACTSRGITGARRGTLVWGRKTPGGGVRFPPIHFPIFAINSDREIPFNAPSWGFGVSENLLPVLYSFL